VVFFSVFATEAATVAETGEKDSMYVPCTFSLTANDYSVFVTSEFMDITMDPAKSVQLVVETVVAHTGVTCEGVGRGYLG
jgi:hypothetical protein